MAASAFTTWATLRSIRVGSTALFLGVRPSFVHGVEQLQSLTDYWQALKWVFQLIYDHEWVGPPS